MTLAAASRFVGFLNRHERSVLMPDGLVHMFSPCNERLRYPDGRIRLHDGWAPYCAQGLMFKETLTNDVIQEVDRATSPITCIQCLGA